MQICNHIYTALASVMAVGMTMGQALAQQVPASQIAPVTMSQQVPGTMSMWVPYVPYGAPFPQGDYRPRARGNYPLPGYVQPQGYPPRGGGNWFGGNNVPWTGNWGNHDLPWPGSGKYRGRRDTIMPWQGWQKNRYPWNRQENYEILPWNWNINNGPWNGWVERHRKFKNRKYNSGGSSIDIR